MPEYSIQNTAAQLGISPYTLRYYDKIGLVCPQRKENRYRYYTEQDIVTLQYIEVIKYAGFSLADIKQIIRNRKDCNGSSIIKTLGLLANRVQILEQKIEMYRQMVLLLTKAQQIVNRKKTSADFPEMNQMIITLFAEMRKNTI